MNANAPANPKDSNMYGKRSHISVRPRRGRIADVNKQCYKYATRRVGKWKTENDERFLPLRVIETKEAIQTYSSFSLDCFVPRSDDGGSFESYKSRSDN
jgi:hypothetical protein